MTITLEWDIDCRPETAFDLMADLRDETIWNPKAVSAEMTSDGPVGAGSTFHLVHEKPDRENEARITEYERPTDLQLAIQTQDMDIVATYSFRPDEGRTRFRAHFEPSPKGAMRVLLPVLKPLIRRQVASNHRSFSAACEVRAATTEGA